MLGYNHIVLVGNLTRDPEIRYVASGAPVTKFSIAIGHKTKGGEGVTFVSIVAWNKLAEICNTYLKKGATVLVDGRLHIREYEDKDGARRTATEIVANNLRMLDKRGTGEAAPEAIDDEQPEDEPPF